jgi:deazaflavin-dependent oxidoreductase (nitroreductase family)
VRPGATEARLFRALNAVLEPSVRKGFGSPSLAPGALIVLETKGHRTGRLSKIPLASLRVGEHILVGTFRGRRSHWVKNLAAQPKVRFWLGGRARPATAIVFPPGRAPRKRKELSAAACALLPLLGLYTSAGWGFAFLTPSPKTPARARAKLRPRSPRPARGA